MKKKFISFLMAMLLFLTVSEGLKSDAVDRELNIITTFGRTQTMYYNIPNAFDRRYQNMATKVRAPYSYMGLDLNFLTSSMLVCEAPVDTCGIAANVNFEMICQHSSLVSCNNNGPFHCTNAAYNILYVFPRPRPVVNGVEMFLTAMPLCVMKNGRHLLISGAVYSDSIIVGDSDHIKDELELFDSENVRWTAATVAHEIGHMYGAVDHYEVEFGDRRDNCIWGYNKDSDSVVNGLAICYECYDTIRININE